VQNKGETSRLPFSRFNHDKSLQTLGADSAMVVVGLADNRMFARKFLNINDE
jgi:hypothetical protein